jgi:spermidine/putrescine transport system substrate-binding protein
MTPKTRMNRRKFLKTSAALAGGLLAASCASPAASPTSPPAPKIGGVLNNLGWEGYDIPTAAKAFQDANGITLNNTYIGSNEEVLTKFQAGGPGKYDMGNVTIRFFPSMIEQNMVLPLDLARLPNWNDFYAQFKSDSPTLDMLQKDGKIYGVPAYFGLNVISYNADLVERPTTWDVLIDPKYKDKVGLYDTATATVFLIAAILGHGTDARKYTKAILAEVVEWGKKWKANSKTLVKSYGEMTDLLVRGDIWMAAEGWEFVTIKGRDQGVNLDHSLPDGPAKAWCDCYFIFQGGSNVDTAYAWLNNAISPEVMAQSAQDLGSFVTNSKAADKMPKDFAEAMHFSDLNTTLGRASFSRFPDPGNEITVDDMLKAYEEIKAA